VTPPRNQDRAGGDDLVAPVISLRRRGLWDVGPRDPCPPAPECTFFDAPDDPAPILGERNIWDGRPIKLRLLQPQPTPSEVRERPREPATQPPRERLATPRLVAGAATPSLCSQPSRRIAPLGGGDAHAARDQSQPTRTDISVAPRRPWLPLPCRRADRRCPSATCWRALAAPCARARTRRREWARRSARSGRVADCSARRERAELKRLVRAFRRAELERQPRPPEELTHGCARVVGHRSGPVRAGRPGVLSQPGTETKRTLGSSTRLVGDWTLSGCDGGLKGSAHHR
jgi:hypothetical protein